MECKKPFCAHFKTHLHNGANSKKVKKQFKALGNSVLIASLKSYCQLYRHVSTLKRKRILGHLRWHMFVHKGLLDCSTKGY